MSKIACTKRGRRRAHDRGLKSFADWARECRRKLAKRNKRRDRVRPKKRRSR